LGAASRADAGAGGLRAGPRTPELAGPARAAGAVAPPRGDPGPVRLGAGCSIVWGDARHAGAGHRRRGGPGQGAGHPVVRCLARSERRRGKEPGLAILPAGCGSHAGRRPGRGLPAAPARGADADTRGAPAYLKGGRCMTTTERTLTKAELAELLFERV